MRLKRMLVAAMILVALAGLSGDRGLDWNERVAQPQTAISSQV